MSLQLYRRLAPNRKTENQLNALHIALENRMTPIEAFQIAQMFAAPHENALPVLPELAENARRFAQSQMQQLATAGKPKPEGFRRQRIRKQMIRASDPAIPRREKTLILCFTGRAQRMTMPLAPFLQHLDASTMDAVVIYPKRAHLNLDYMLGFSGLGDNLYESIDRLPALLGMEDYARTLAIGTSGSGIPAVIAALRLGLPTAVAAVPNDPNDPRWFDVFGAPLPDELVRMAKSKPLPAIHVVYSPDNARDKTNAEALAQILPVSPFKILAPNVPNQILHAILGYAMSHGRLSELLDRTLFNSSLSKQEIT
jgi:hypothetical protein